MRADGVPPACRSVLYGLVLASLLLPCSARLAEALLGREPAGASQRVYTTAGILSSCRRLLSPPARLLRDDPIRW